MIKAGIYFIINLYTGMIYVGSAINFKERRRNHYKALNGNYHGNKYLQAAWNIYGEEAFQFTIVEIVEDVSRLLEIEQLWIEASDCCNSEIGYNLNPTAGSNLGIKWSDDYKEKMSLVLKGKIKSKEWLSNIKTAILLSDKKFKNKRNSNKWPHEKGARCSCSECREKKKFYMRENYYKKKNIALEMRA